MIIEITKYVSVNKLILVVSDILSVDFKWESSTESPLDKNQYEVNIQTTKEIHRLWFNGDKEKAEQVYLQVKTALDNFYKKDIIGAEIKEYLSKINFTK
jgi:hypothetical protein